MMDARADVNAVMCAGWTPLLDAARHGRLRSTREVLRRGADVNVMNNGNTSLRLTNNNRHSKVAEGLRGTGGRE